MKPGLVLCLFSLAIGACSPTDRGDDGGGGGGGDDGSGSGSGSGSGPGSNQPQQQCNKMDIVFVVDDSGSMSEEQTNLSDNFPAFANLLANFHNANGDLVDFRIGLTTTGHDLTYHQSTPAGTLTETQMGEDGAFRNNCGGPGRWVDSMDSTMATSLECRAKVGTNGPGIEMPLLMGKYALSERANDVNAGFVRSDALLALVMITDEDDQSTAMTNFTLGLTDPWPADWGPAEEVGFLDTLKGGRSRWAAAAIAGDGDCMSSFGNATDAPRLKQFVDQANSGGSTQAVFSSICAGDLTLGLQDALETFGNACNTVVF